MFKSKIMKALIDFADDIFSLIGLVFAALFVLLVIGVAVVFAYHSYPTATEITLWVIGAFFAIAAIGWVAETLQHLKNNKAAK